MRNYYICSVGEPGRDYVEDNLERIIANTAFYMHKDTTQVGLYDNIKPKDILILKYNKVLIAYGEALGNLKNEEDEKWTYKSPVKEWYFYDEGNQRKGVNYYGIQWETLPGAGQMGTVKGVTNNFGFKKIEEISSTSPLYKQLLMETPTGKIDSYKQLLAYKKQIILQGPPGTGKTRLAEEIANSFIGNTGTLSLQEYTQYYIENFQPTDKTQEIDQTTKNLLREFQALFPLERLKNIEIDDYALGNGSRDSFCYMIEKGLAYTCRFSPGPAGTTVYGISYNKDDGSLRVDKDENPESYMDKIRQMLVDLVGSRDYKKAKEMKKWDSFILKILHSYYPEEYFPVLSRNHLKIFAQIFGVNATGLNDIQLNMAINEKFHYLKNMAGSSISSVVLMRHLYEKFELKDNDISNIIIHNQVKSAGEYKLVQFHPSYTYEDFVRGIVAETRDKSITYQAKNKILAEIAEKAVNNPKEKFILIIDEINRANLSSVLGELIYALEYRYYFNSSDREKKKSEVESLYGIKSEGTGDNLDYSLKLPENLYIIGTMNTADRSVGHIDYAIRRRFAFVDVLPENLKVTQGLDAFDGDLFEKVADLFKHINADFEVKDVQLGHSYFIDKSGEPEGVDIKLRWKYEIKPILLEYIKDGILKEIAKKEIAAIDESYA